jgi:hypothetical protein
MRILQPLFLIFFIGFNRMNSYFTPNYFDLFAKNFIIHNYQYFSVKIVDLELVSNFSYNDYLGYSINQMELNIFIIKYLVKQIFLLKS